jgi:hypothetical protein
MQLLKRSGDSEDGRKHNADKKQLLAKEHHPRTALIHRQEWSFIEDPILRDNIAYQMQYLEFLVNLYNDYQVYLTAESLLCKDILATVGGIVEAALFDRLQATRSKAGLSMVTRTDFSALLGEAYHAANIISRETWHYFHELRKVRNYVHLTAADFREHSAYTVHETNEAITRLEQFRKDLTRTPLSS